MEPHVWITLAIQAVGTAITVGVFIQQHREYARRIADLEAELETRVRRDIFTRAEEEIRDLKVRVRDLERHDWSSRRTREAHNP